MVMGKIIHRQFGGVWMGSSGDGALIVTSAIHTRDPYLAIKAPNVRLAQLYCSMICWIRQTRVKNIILCDNTSTDQTFPGLVKLAENAGKKLEILQFNGDHRRVASHGKGFGEGEIIRHVMSESVLLREEASFFKVTGRVFVENFDDIWQAEQGNDTVFNLNMKRWKRLAWRIIANCPLLHAKLGNRGIGHIQTVFYKCGVRYYRENLLDSYMEVNDREDRSLENRMFMPLMRHGFSTFSLPPRLVGYSAGLGSLYGGRDFSDEVKREADELIAASRRP